MTLDSADRLSLALEKLNVERTRRRTENKLGYFKPYPKQLAFFTAGKTCRERLLMAGNQIGKSMASAYEVACHVTGRYPADWPGRRWDRAVHGWVAGVSNEVVRDTVQRLLLGLPGEHGSGMIPKDALVDVVAARGIADSIDVIRVKHVSGEVSTITFKSYSAERAKFQGSSLDFVALDEEPPFDVYTESLTRTNATGGMVWLTFTPLLGPSEVVRRFLYDRTKDMALIQATIDDADHFSDKQKEAIIASYPKHELEARTRGEPSLGSGAIYPIPVGEIICEHRTFPPHFARLGAIDFGFLNAAFVELVHDRDTDVIYVAKALKIREQSPVLHASAVRPWGKKLRWVWPKDGKAQTAAGGGISLAEQYQQEGLDMWPEHAQFADGGTSVEAGLMEVLSRLETGRLKVFSHLNDWLAEYRLYHRKDGKVVKEHDHLLDATRYGVMMIRYARTDSSAQGFNRKEILYPPGYFQTATR